MNWIHRLRIRVLAWLIGIAMVGVAIASWAALPAWPVVGVAVAVVVAAVSTMTSRLVVPTCWGCGTDLASIEPGEHGFICPECGSVNQMLAASSESPFDDMPDAARDGDDSDDAVA